MISFQNLYGVEKTETAKVTRSKSGTYLHVYVCGATLTNLLYGIVFEEGLSSFMDIFIT